MKRFAITVLLSGLLAVLLPVTPSRTAESPSEPVSDVAAEIKALQKERIAALTSVVQMLLVQYRRGTSEFRPLALAHRDLLAAELDATEAASERIVLIERELKAATDALRIAELRFDAGAGTQVDTLQAKAVVLDTKIQLLRERAKAAAK